VSEVLPAVNAHSRIVTQPVEELQIERLGWRSPVDRKADMQQRRDIIVWLEDDPTGIQHVAFQGWLRGACQAGLVRTDREWVWKPTAVEFDRRTDGGAA